MKNALKKYWWVLVIIVTAPIVINYVVLLPAIGPIVGDATDWLSFWGGYLSAIVSAIIAFVILFIQREENKKENEKNRELQIKSLEYQQQMQWLNDLRKVIKENLSAYDINITVDVINMIYKNISCYGNNGKNNIHYEIHSRIKTVQNNVRITDVAIDTMMRKNVSDDSIISTYKTERDFFLNSYLAYLDDLEILSLILCYSIKKSDLDSVIKGWRTMASTKLQEFVDQYTNDDIYNVSGSRIDETGVLCKGIFDDLCNATNDFLSKEENRINSIVNDAI